MAVDSVFVKRIIYDIRHNFLKKTVLKKQLIWEIQQWSKDITVNDFGLYHTENKVKKRLIDKRSQLVSFILMINAFNNSSGLTQCFDESVLVCNVDCCISISGDLGLKWAITFTLFVFLPNSNHFAVMLSRRQITDSVWR